jgi:hypothetical protein
MSTSLLQILHGGLSRMSMVYANETDDGVDYILVTD